MIQTDRKKNIVAMLLVLVFVMLTFAAEGLARDDGGIADLHGGGGAVDRAGGGRHSHPVARRRRQRRRGV